VALEVAAKLFRNEADPLTDAHRRQFVPLHEAMGLAGGRC
jgi:hypothetical protein